MSHTITLIPGDGVGPEITVVVRRCVSALGVDVDWDVQQAGAGVIEKEKKPLPDRVIDSITKNKVALKGPVRSKRLQAKAFGASMSSFGARSTCTHACARANTTRAYAAAS